MHRGWAAAAAVVVAAVAIASPLAGAAGATHDDETLWVTVAINAAGADRISVRENLYDSDHVGLVSEVAVALGRPVGSFRAVEKLDGANAVLDDKLPVADGRGRLSYELDTGRLQLLAQRHSYESVGVRVCTPRVRQVVDVLEAPQSLPFSSPGSRCRGWFRLVDEAPVRAVVQLSPDRHRYSSAVSRSVGAAACAFGLLGMGATLLRHGPLRRRSAGSWVLAVGSAVGVTALGWSIVTLLLWWTGATADALLLGGGSQREQVARVLLPGLVFAVPALLPAALLLTVPAKERAGPPAPPPAPPVPMWWPTAWWPHWAAQQAARAPQGQVPPPPPGSSPSGWAAPGSGGG